MLAYGPAFVDELEKIAWFGTYYHGTSPKAEKSILREGLKASYGGKGGGAVQTLVEKIVGKHPVIQKFQKETAGKVSVSRSKLLSKIYGLVGHRKEVTRAMMKAKLLGRKAIAQEALKQLVMHQPLEVSGKALKMTRDPSHFFFGVQTSKDIPASLIRKAEPSRLGRLLTKVLTRR